MLNRRAFLQRFGIGLTAALTLASLPASAVEHLTQTEAGKLIACEFLRKIYNTHAAGSVRNHPTVMHAGRELFEAYEGELLACERFTDREAEARGEHVLKFKGARLRCVGRGWRAEVAA